VKVDIYTDVVCPWSYLGKRRFEAALAQFAGRADVQVEWKPFQLDRSAESSADGAALSSSDTELDGNATIEELAAAEGLILDLDNTRSASSFAAHRLLWWARQEGGEAAQTALAERLFAAHHAEAVDLDDHAALAALAAAVGLDGAAQFLATHDGTDEVKEAIGEARAIGIESTPTFVFEERWAVSGAQPADVMQTLLEQVADATIGAMAGGGGCCGGGCCGS
jgi:predicted DsbA family dithiol-disulfide isomerase